MSHEQESQLETLYNFLKTQGYRPTAYNSSGKKSLAKDAVIIEFDFIKDDTNYGKSRLSIDGSNTLTVYIDDNVTKSPNAESKDGSLSWTQLLKYLRDFSFGKLTFDVKNADDWEYDMAKRKDSEKLDEGYHSINKNTSYSDNVPNVKIRIQHSKNLGEGEQRYRNVARIFIENADGERFMLETKKPGIARVYARHVAEGGRPYDEKWNHINSLVEDYTKMAGFVRATKNGQFNESTQTLVNEGVSHYMGLRETLHKLSGKKGYGNYFESWSPTLNEDSEGADLSEMFVSSSLDPRIESAMPILAKLSRKVTEMNEVIELDEWASSIIEEDLTPTGRGQIEQIVELLSEPITVGPDALNALALLSSVNLEDSDLENELRDLAYEDSDADAVPVIKNWMQSTSDHRLHAILKQLDGEPQEVAEGPKEVLKLLKFAKGGGILGGQLGGLLGEEDDNEPKQRQWNDDDFYAYDPETNTVKDHWGYKSTGRLQHEHAAHEKGWKVVRGMTAKFMDLNEQMEEEEMQNLSPEMERARQTQEIMISDTPPQDDNLNMLKAWAEYSPHRRIDYYVIAKFGNKGPNRNVFSNSVQKTLDAISNFPDMSGQEVYDQFDLDQRDADRLYVAYENVADELDRLSEQGVAEARNSDTNFGSTVTRGSWVVYDGNNVKRFKSREGAKAYAEKNGGKVASSEFYADNIQKQGMSESVADPLNDIRRLSGYTK